MKMALHFEGEKKGRSECMCGVYLFVTSSTADVSPCEGKRHGIVALQTVPNDLFHSSRLYHGWNVGARRFEPRVCCGHKNHILPLFEQTP